METVELFKEYMEHLFAGNRSRARELIFNAHDRGFSADRLLVNVAWPAMEQITSLFREDHINLVSEHLATRINRMVADQLHMVLNKSPKSGQRLVVLCGASESAELGGQIICDLFESVGWSVWFVGSSVPEDEVVPYLSTIDPQLLMIYDSLPSEVPDVRRLIELIREVGICPEMQIMVCGGIYARAEGLDQEIRADLFARNVREAILCIDENPTRVKKEHKLEPGRRRKRKRKRKVPGVERLKRELGLVEEELAS
jgi:methanogenic corrinoid protein MtbC1